MNEKLITLEQYAMLYWLNTHRCWRYPSQGGFKVSTALALDRRGLVEIHQSKFAALLAPRWKVKIAAAGIAYLEQMLANKA